MITIEYTGSDDYGDHVKALIVGTVGKGKTRFSATARNPLLLDAKAGAASIAEKNLPRVKIDSSDSLLSILKLLEQGREEAEKLLGFPVETVSLDTVDEVARILIRERLKATRQETMEGSDWAWLSEQMNAITSALVDLDMHVLIFSHIKRDGQDEVWQKPDISGGTAYQILQDLDYNLLIDEREVTVTTEDDKRVLTRKAFLISQPHGMYEYLKQRGKCLPEAMELNFEDDFQRVVDLHTEGRTQPKGEVREVEFEEPTAGADPRPAPSAPKKSVQEQTADAERIIAEAEAKAKGSKPERPTLTKKGDPAAELAMVDLSSYGNGDRVVLEGEVPSGYFLDSEGKIKQERNIRFVYEVNGDKILSRNQLEQGVTPVPNPAIDSGVFCQVTGVELLPEDANISRIRARKVLCEAEFEKAIDRKKK